MANTIEIIIRATDKASEVIRDALGNVGEAGKGLAKGLEGLKPVGTALTGISAAGAASIGMMTNAAADFQSQVALMEVAARSSGTAFDELHDAALAVGGDTRLIGVSAVGAADSITNLYKAGLSTTEVFGDLNAYLEDGAELGGVLRASIDLAAASELDMASGAELVSVAMATYGIKAERASEITNNFVATADASVASVSDLADAMANIGPTAAAFGWSLEDVNTALAILSERGIRGSEAGTALKSMMTNIMRDTDDVVSALKELNVELYDQAGNMLSLPNIIGQLSTAMAGLTEEQRNAYVQTLAGTYGMKAMNTLLAEGETGWYEMADAIDGAASAQDVASAKADTLNGKLEAMQGSWETLTIAMGERFLPTATDVVRKATDLIEKFNELPESTQDTAATLLGVGTAATTAAGGFILLVPKIAQTVDALKKLNEAAPWLMSGTTKVGIPVLAGLLGGNWLSKELTGQGLLGWLTDVEGQQRGLVQANDLATESWEKQQRAIEKAKKELQVLQEANVWAPSQELIDIMGGDIWEAGSAQAVRDKIAELKALIDELQPTFDSLDFHKIDEELGGLPQLLGSFDVNDFHKIEEALGGMQAAVTRLDPASMQNLAEAIVKMGDAAGYTSPQLYDLVTSAGTVAKSFGEMEFTPEAIWEMALGSGASLPVLADLADRLGIAEEAEINATLAAYKLTEALGAGAIAGPEYAQSMAQVGRDLFATELAADGLYVSLDQLPTNRLIRMEAEGFTEAEMAAGRVKGATDLIPPVVTMSMELEGWDEATRVAETLNTDVTGLPDNVYMRLEASGVLETIGSGDEIWRAAQGAADGLIQQYRDLNTEAENLDSALTTAWLNSYGNAVALQEPMLILQGNIEDNTEAALELGRVIVEEVPDAKPLDIYIEEEARLFERMYELKSIHEILGKPVVMQYIVDVEGQLPGVPSVPRYATGTDYHPGGLAVVGESGPELVNLPRGARVYPTGGGGAGAANITININGAIDPSVTANMVMQRLRDQGIARGTPLR